MGEMAEYYMELDEAHECDRQWDDFVGEVRGYWRQKDGKLIAFKAMTLSHLKNAKALIERTEADF